MSLESIVGIQRQRTQRRNNVMKDIYNKVKIRINHHAKFGKTNCTYDVPSIIYGLPHLNLEEVGNYLEDTLIDEGFVVTRLSSTMLYISWEESLVDEQAREDKRKRKMDKKYREMKKIEDQRRNELLKSLEHR